jgi:pre-mRNA-processing factor 6
LTDLQSLPFASGAEIGDFKKARLLLKSLIQSDPKNSFGWLAAARVEELDGKLQAAKNILAQGLQQVEDSEDIWIECARLETQDKAK